eukprot:TRINITY_DN10185_c0_g1_i1.p1 TRINITY_DN10185_c0_g1~~TRINITY_DN10185_c0_g1_i1.p1  ORF type:complete len:470 (-),score=81.54 TRINITY_DN10185_c0_g1_i1:410-1819(-)
MAGAEPLLDRPVAQWRRFMYVSHFVASWGERMWEFSAGLLLLQLSGGQSLALPALFGFTLQLTAALLGPKVGSLVDSEHSLRIPLAALAGQNSGIALAALSAWLAFVFVAPAGLRSSAGLQAAVACVLCFSCVAKLASLARQLALEKRWAKALTAGDVSDLATLNGTLRRIDLSCKIIAPIASGAVMSSLSPASAAAAVAAANVLAWPIEAYCLRTVWADAWCRARLDDPGGKSSSKQVATGASALPDSANACPPGSGEALAAEGKVFQLYFAQRGLWPSTFALSMLHFTVLSFGQVMTAYVMTLGIDAWIVAFYRSLGEIFGVTATVLAPRIVARWGAASSATIFIWMQVAMLVPATVGASSWARSNLSPACASALLVGGVGTSRLGLWGFDLSVTQLLQERVVPDSALAFVSGLQHSFESTFGACASIMGIVLCAPSQFGILAMGSFLTVFSAASLHTTSAAFGDGS